MNELIIVSVDDHIGEPPGLFDKHLSGAALACAPKFETTERGTNYWEYQGLRRPSIGLNSVVGRVPEEYGMEPTSIDQLRKAFGGAAPLQKGQPFRVVTSGDVKALLAKHAYGTA